MAKLKPVVAKDLRSLELHLNNLEPAILIFNNKMIPEIKKRVKEDQDNRNSLNNVMKGLAVAGLGYIFLPVSGLIFGSMIVGGLVLSANKIWKRINVKLGEYTWSESEINGAKVLLLSKNFGDNKLLEDDEIDLTDLESILKEENK